MKLGAINLSDLIKDVSKKYEYECRSINVNMRSKRILDVFLKELCNLRNSYKNIENFHTTEDALIPLYIKVLML